MRCILFVFFAVSLNACYLPVDQDVVNENMMFVDFTQNEAWDDGKAEISIYTIKERVNDKVTTAKFVRTLVKHQYDTVNMKKPSEGTADSSHPEVFLWGQFNRSKLESTNINESIFVTVLRSSLEPIKQTISEQSLEGNALIESRYINNQVVEIFTGDLYTEPIDTFLVKPNHYPIMQLPLLIRALPFDSISKYTIAFDLPHYDLPELIKMVNGKTDLRIDIKKIGEEIINLKGVNYNTEKIEVSFEDKAYLFPAIYHQGEMPEKEIYWRSMTFPNTVLKQKAIFDNDYGDREVFLDTTYRSAWWNVSF